MASIGPQLEIVPSYGDLPMSKSGSHSTDAGHTVITKSAASKAKKNGHTSLQNSVTVTFAKRHIIIIMMP